MSLCPEACYRQGYKAAGIEFKLQLCVLFMLQEKLCTITLQHLRQTFVMIENDCVGVVSQEMVPEVFWILPLLLSVFFALAVFASVCMHTRGETLTIHWLEEIRGSLFVERQERSHVLFSLFSHQFWPFSAASPCHRPPSMFPRSKNEIYIISYYGPSSS